MVSYANTNALSMLGGDDYSDVVASLANFVTTNTAQTILSGADKTHDEINNFQNDVNVYSPLLVNSGSVDIESGGTCIFKGNDTVMTIQATDTLATGLTGSIYIEADQDININRTSNNGLSGTIQFNSNGNIELYAADPLAIGVGGIVIQALRDIYIKTTSPTNNIVLSVAGLDKLDIAYTLTTNTNATITEVATTAFKVQNVGGTDKLNIAPTLTKNLNSTITNVATTAFKVQNVDGTDKLNIAPTLTKNTNATITELATTAFKVQNVDAVDKLTITALGVTTMTDYNTNVIATNTLQLTGGAVSVYSDTSITLTGPGNYTITPGGYLSMIVGSSYQLVVNGVGQDLYTDAASSTSTISTMINTIYKQQMSATLTTLTNTNVDIVAPLHSTTYFVGTTAANTALASLSVDFHQNMGILNATEVVMSNSWGAAATQQTGYMLPFACKVIGFSLTSDNNAAIIGTSTSSQMTLKAYNKSSGVSIGSSVSGFATFATNNATPQYGQGLLSTGLPGTTLAAGQILGLSFSQSYTGTMTGNNKILTAKIWLQQV